MQAPVKLSRATKPFIMDADQHIYEPPTFWTSRMTGKFAEQAPHVVDFPPGGQAWVFEGGKWIRTIGLEVGAGRGYTEIKNYGHSYANTRRGCYEAIERLRDMDIDGVDRSLIFPSNGMAVRGIRDPELLLACTHAYNESIWDWCQAGDADRLIALNMIPDVDTGAALAELKWSLDTGFKGGMLTGWPSGSGRPQPEDEPIWARAEEAGYVICLHTGGPTSAERGPTGPSIEGGEMRPPVRTADLIGPGKSSPKGTNVTWFVLSGILERYPHLKIALVETGSGWLPFYLEQLDDAFYRARTDPPFDQLTMAPSAYLRRQMWTTLQIDTVAIKNRHAIGIDRIMWTSDYPHSGYGSEWPSSRLFIEQQFRGVPEPELRRMLGENCAELFGVPATPSTRPGSLH